jgi:hypothetical protein
MKLQKVLLAILTKWHQIVHQLGNRRLSVIGTLTLLLAGLASCANSAPPLVYTGNWQALKMVTPEQICVDYTTDQVVADTKYNGKEVLFYEVVVESIFFSERESYLRIGDIRFEPTDPTDLDDIRVGYTVTITGICQGKSNYTIVISDCFVEFVKGYGFDLPEALPYTGAY